MTSEASPRVAVAGAPEAVKRYIAAARGVGLDPVPTLAPGDIAGFSGLILPGGGDIDPALYGAENCGSADIDRPLDEAQLRLAEAFLRAGKPVLGICKGVQVLNVLFGGDIVQHLPTTPLHRGQRDVTHPVVSLPGSDMERLYGRRYTVNSMHHQGLGRLGDGLVATSRALDGVPESVVHETLPVLGVQWHPERMCFAMARPDAVDGGSVFRLFRSMMET